MADWYYATEAGTKGPIDERALQHLFSAGAMPPETSVCQVGTFSWLPASQVPNFFELVRPDTIPAPDPAPATVPLPSLVSAPPSIPPTYVITPVTPKPKPSRVESPPPSAPTEKAGFVKRFLRGFTAQGKNTSPASPPTATSSTTLLKVPYGMGARHFLLLVLCAGMALLSAGFAASNKRGLIIDHVIYLSPSQVTIFFEAGTALFGLGCVIVLIGLLRRLLPPWCLKITDRHLIIPRVFFPGASKVPLTAINVIRELSRRGRAQHLVLTTSQGSYCISVSLLPRRSDYDTVKQTLTKKGVSGRVAPWKRSDWSTANAGSFPPARKAAAHLGWIFGTAALAFGGFFTWITLQSSAHPTTVPIAQFETSPPDTRNVVITGGNFDFPHAVKFSLYHFTGDNAPDLTYYVPLLDAPATNSLVVPKVVVKMSASALMANEKKINPDRLPVTRLTQWDFQSEAKARMRQTFGAGIDNMIVVEYGAVPNLYFGLSFIIVGVLLIAFRNVVTRRN